MTMLGHCDNQNTGEGSPCALRLSRGLKVRLSVVLGRATRVCANHITGITCGGVVVSSDVFDCPRSRSLCAFYLRGFSGKRAPICCDPGVRAHYFVTRAGKASRE